MDNKIIAIIVTVIVVIAGAGIYFFVSDDDDDFMSHDVRLEIFGNANGDNKLDNNDVDEIQKYINGDITESQLIKVVLDDDKIVGGIERIYYLADANLDGIVNDKDIKYLEGIIDRPGEHMNFVDTFGNLIKDVPLKINRIASDYFATDEVLQLMGVQDKIVASSKASQVLEEFYLQGV